MLRKRLCLCAIGSVVFCVALALAPTSASADDVRLTVQPAVYSATASVPVQLVHWHGGYGYGGYGYGGYGYGGYGGYPSWGGYYGGYGYPGYYSSYYPRAYGGVYSYPRYGGYGGYYGGYGRHCHGCGYY